MSDFKSKMHQIQFRLGLRPRPRWGSLRRSPRPPSCIKGALLLTGREGRGEEGDGEGREGKGERKRRGREKGKRRGGEGRELPRAPRMLGPALLLSHTCIHTQVAKFVHSRRTHSTWDSCDHSAATANAVLGLHPTIETTRGIARCCPQLERRGLPIPTKNSRCYN